MLSFTRASLLAFWWSDLESMGYVFVYFLKGCLPWMGLKARTKDDKYGKIREKKTKTSVEELCKNLPRE